MYFITFMPKTQSTEKVINMGVISNAHTVQLQLGGCNPKYQGGSTEYHCSCNYKSHSNYTQKPSIISLTEVLLIQKDN